MKASFADELIALLPRLRRMAQALTGAADGAQDLVQSTCELALRAEGQFMPGTRLDAWVMRIMRNRWIDIVRQRRPERSAQTLDSVAEPVGSDGRATTENALMLADVSAALAMLPDDQRRLLLFVCAEERSYQDAAAEFGIPMGTVMSRLARARARLAEALDPEAAPRQAAPKPEARRAIP